MHSECFLYWFHMKVWIFATDKYKLLSFLNQNRESFESYFIREECNEHVNKIYTLDDLYKQIEHTVDSVSNYTVVL